MSLLNEKFRADFIDKVVNNPAFKKEMAKFDDVAKQKMIRKPDQELYKAISGTVYDFKNNPQVVTEKSQVEKTIAKKTMAEKPVAENPIAL